MPGVWTWCLSGYHKKVESRDPSAEVLDWAGNRGTVSVTEILQAQGELAAPARPAGILRGGGVLILYGCTVSLGEIRVLVNSAAGCLWVGPPAW